MHQEGPSQQLFSRAHGTSSGIASLRVQSNESMYLYDVNWFFRHVLTEPIVVALYTHPFFDFMIWVNCCSYLLLRSARTCMLVALICFFPGFLASVRCSN